MSETTVVRTKEWAVDTAEEILATIRHGDPHQSEDSGHRFCSNCHVQLREVEPPKPKSEFFDRWGGEVVYSSDGMDVTNAYLKYEDSPETEKAAIGRAYPTIHMVSGESVRSSELRPGEPIISKSLVCECGATRHTQIERPVSKATAIRYARKLSTSIEALRDEARMSSKPAIADRAEEWRHSRDVLVETVRRLKSRRDMQGEKPIFKAALAVALRRPNQ